MKYNYLICTLLLAGSAIVCQQPPQEKDRWAQYSAQNMRFSSKELRERAVIPTLRASAASVLVKRNGTQELLELADNPVFPILVAQLLHDPTIDHEKKLGVALGGALKTVPSNPDLAKELLDLLYETRVVWHEDVPGTFKALCNDGNDCISEGPFGADLAKQIAQVTSEIKNTQEVLKENPDDAFIKQKGALLSQKYTRLKKSQLADCIACKERAKGVFEILDKPLPDNQKAQRLKAYFDGNTTDLLICDDEGRNCLQCAGILNRETASVLIERANSPDLFTKNSSGDLANPYLINVCTRGQLDLLKQILSYQENMDVTIPNELGATALMWACYHDEQNQEAQKRYEDIARLLFEHGAKEKIDYQNRDGQTALHCACMKGHDNLVAALVDAGANLDIVDNKFRTPLFVARKEGNTNIVEYLLGHGAFDQDNNDVVEAVKKNDIKGLHFLVIAGAVNAKGKWGRTPLHCVLEPEVAKVLIENGAKVQATDDLGKTPLHYAQMAKVARLLLESGAKVHAKDTLGRTPLHRVQEPKVARLLLESGAKVHAKDTLGGTPLHCVQEPKVVKVLIEFDADLHAEDKWGRAPLHWARTAELAKLLLEYGANVHAKDNQGKKPIDYAQDPEVKKLLEDAMKSTKE